MKATRNDVVLEAWTWYDTPYHDHARIKGVGVDCAQILLAVFCDALKLAPPLDVGQYSTQWHLHRSEEVYLDWLERAGAKRVQAPAPGDIAMFRYGRTFHHSAICLGELFIHAYSAPISRVIVTRLDEEPLVGRDVQFWSIFQ